MQLIASVSDPDSSRNLQLAESLPSSIAPLACTLSASGQQDRLEQWERVLGEVEHWASVADGLVLRFRLDLDLAHTLLTRDSR
ncbi:hypothetical protein [Rhodococcus sp. ARC_M6]|uniref:hypothetical protein n=1 Tax=Rhodococcus sp. ARC_M6 TaxID=2928852 RepID=UPI001FB1F902|nr:hypothetical protein [Rhodococcus sp. ARC_M6]MCJ0905184.1 hypothetical protein [Rhodococcus sp. ARC_M6]